MTLGEKVYRLRIEKGLSQEALGEALGVSRQSVSKWETDQSVPELDKIVAISDMFGVSTDYLLKETGETINEADNQDRTVEFENSNIREAQTIIVRPRFEYEYKSEKCLGGLPLVHVNIGVKPVRAKGVIAIGNIAQGIVAIGIVGVGVITLAPLGIGFLLVIGACAFGGIALGSIAVGIVGFGAVCISIFSTGALAIGQFSVGALAIGHQIAIGDAAYGNIALGDSEAQGVFFGAVRAADGNFDYEGIIRAIDVNVAGYWHIFTQWMKAIIRMMAGVR